MLWTWCISNGLDKQFVSSSTIRVLPKHTVHHATRNENNKPRSLKIDKHTQGSSLEFKRIQSKVLSRFIWTYSNYLAHFLFRYPRFMFRARKVTKWKHSRGFLFVVFLCISQQSWLNCKNEMFTSEQWFKWWLYLNIDKITYNTFQITFVKSSSLDADSTIHTSFCMANGPSLGLCSTYVRNIRWMRYCRTRSVMSGVRD